jgi:chemotaxis protein CheY-P-specific phosphatase CheC
MNESEKFQNMFPFILENIVREMGDLIGEDLDLQDENINQGNLKEIFSPSNKKFVLTGFNLKHRPSDSAYLLVNLDMAVDLGGRLIMLPEKEILACKKQGKLEGELLDAFSEITNIITGVINSNCQEYIPSIKLQFIKGKIEIFPPRTDSLPMPQGNHTLLSASLALQDGNSGILQLFFPHTLLENENVEEGLPSEDNAEENMNISTLTSTPRSNQTADSINDSEVSENSNITTSGGNENEQNKDFDGSFSEDKRPNPKFVEIFLKEGLDPVKEGLEALLGNTIEFFDERTDIRKKDYLTNKIKDNRVLTKFKISGDREGEGYILLPLKDAILFGGFLLIMPEESIKLAIKQSKFEGELADAFGEITNILVGCYSNQFATNFPLKLHFKKDHLDTLIPAYTDLSSNDIFRTDHYYILSFMIRMGNKTHGPLEILFPLDVLGLLKPPDSQESTPNKRVVDQSSDQTQERQPEPAQETDAISTAGKHKEQTRIISIISQDKSQLDFFQENFIQENVEVMGLSLENDLKQNLTHKNLCCVFLFIKKVNDLGFAQTIQVRTALKKGCPLIVAGPEWTRSKVLKALKYGATDVLITPAERESILRKFQKHLYQPGIDNEHYPDANRQEKDQGIY